MAKKKSNRPHGHYCKIYGEYKANERFSGKDYAAHICKVGKSISNDNFSAVSEIVSSTHSAPNCL